MKSQTVMEELVKPKTSFEDIKVPPLPGVYAFFVKQGSGFLSIKSNQQRLIYIGMSSNLYQREFNAHFDSKNTGFSTLRRSIGAILKEQYSFTAIPRGTGSASSNYTCYRFKPENEDIITSWMINNLEVGICPYTGDIKQLETELIELYQPILCLTGWKNPMANYLKGLRKACAEEARSYKS